MPTVPTRIRAGIQDAGKTLHHLGLTEGGYPKHPLYLSASTAPEAWPLKAKTSKDIFGTFELKAWHPAQDPNSLLTFHKPDPNNPFDLEVTRMPKRKTSQTTCNNKF